VMEESYHCRVISRQLITITSLYGIPFILFYDPTCI
jgi:hypothetical protein